MKYQIPNAICIIFISLAPFTLKGQVKIESLDQDLLKKSLPSIYSYIITDLMASKTEYNYNPIYADTTNLNNVVMVVDTESPSRFITSDSKSISMKEIRLLFDVDKNLIENITLPYNFESIVVDSLTSREYEDIISNRKTLSVLRFSNIYTNGLSIYIAVGMRRNIRSDLEIDFGITHMLELQFCPKSHYPFIVQKWKFGPLSWHPLSKRQEIECGPFIEITPDPALEKN